MSTAAFISDVVNTVDCRMPNRVMKAALRHTNLFFKILLKSYFSQFQGFSLNAINDFILAVWSISTRHSFSACADMYSQWLRFAREIIGGSQAASVDDGACNVSTTRQQMTMMYRRTRFEVVRLAAGSADSREMHSAVAPQFLRKWWIADDR